MRGSFGGSLRRWLYGVFRRLGALGIGRFSGSATVAALLASLVAMAPHAVHAQANGNNGNCGSSIPFFICLWNAQGNATAGGDNANAGGAYATAIGGNANANGSYATATGYQAYANGATATAYGANSSAVDQASAIGYGTTASQTGATALGYQAAASGQYSIAIGTGAVASGGQSISIGTGNNVTGNNSGAFGDPNIINGASSYAVGNNNAINGNNSFVFGNNVNAGALISVSVLGDSALVGGNYATALGAGANAAYASDVALGAGSITDVPHTGITAGFGGTAAGTSGTNGVVSIGSMGNERQIQNVGAGVISTTSTDAINGSQLFATNTQVSSISTLVADGLNFTGNDATAGVVNRQLGDTLTISGTATAAGTYSGGNLKTVTDPATGTINLQMADSPQFGTVIVNAGGTGKITGVTAGTVNDTSTDAVNGSQLYAVQQTANAGWNVTTAATGTGTVAGTSVTNIAPGNTVTLTAGDNIAVTQSGSTLTIATSMTPTFTTVTTGNTVVDTSGVTILNGVTPSVNLTNAGLTIASGPSITTSGIDAASKIITNVAAGTTTMDAVNYGQLQTVQQTANAGWNVTTAATGTGTVAGTSVTNVAPDATVTFTAGNNIAVTQNGSTLTIATSMTPTFTTVTTGNTVMDTSGVTILNGVTPSVSLTNAGLTIASGPSITTSGIDAASKVITNVAAGTTTMDAVNYGQLQTVQQTANAGWNVTTAATGTGTVTGTSVTNIAPGNTVTLTAGDNIAVTQSGSTLTIATSMTPTFTTVTTGNTVMDTSGVTIFSGTTPSVSLTNAGLTIASGPSITTSGIDAAGKVITNVAAGTAATDAVNVSQLQTVQQTANAGWNVTTAATGTGMVAGISVTNVAPGNTVTFTAGDNIAVTQNGQEIQVALNPVLTGITSIAVTGGPTIGSTGIDMGGQKITNVASGTISSISTDAINGSQLYTVATNTSAYLGGGANVLAGTAPSYTMQGTTYHDVGSALGGINSNLTTIYSDIANINANISSTAGPVQRLGTTNQLALVAAGGNGTNPGTPQLLTNVAPGAINSTSTDAINGSQLYTVTTYLGGGSNVLNGAAPSYTFAGGSSFNNVGDALLYLAGLIGSGGAGGSNTTDNLGSSVASNLGGGAAYDSTPGTVSAPTYNVGGHEFNNVGDTITALQTGAPVQYAAPDSTPQGYKPSQEVTLVGADPSAPVVLHNVAAGVAPADAVNVGQLQQVAANVPGRWQTSNTYVFSNSAGGGGPVTLDNVAPGSIGPNSTQAVNGAQLYQTNLALMQTNQALNNLAAFTTTGLAKANAGAAAGIAAASLVQAASPGKSVVSGGVGYWNGQATLAFGLSHRFIGDLNGWTMRASGVVSAAGNGAGGGFGLGYEF